jgi:hypothetical protein
MKKKSTNLRRLQVTLNKTVGNYASEAVHLDNYTKLRVSSKFVLNFQVLYLNSFMF